MELSWVPFLLVNIFTASAVISFPIQLFGNSSYGALGILATASPFVPSAKIGSRCQQQVERFLQDLSSVQLWATQMYDASAKTPSGLLNGNVHAMGDFWECLNIHEELTGSAEDGGGTIRGKYCQVDAYLEISNSSLIDPQLSQVLELMLSHRAVQSNFYDGVKFFPTFSPITWGFCIPNSCSHEEVQKTVESALRPVNDTPGLVVRLHSSPHSCDEHRERSFHSGSALLTMIILWIVLGTAIFGALLEILFPLQGRGESDNIVDSGWYKVITAFSLKRNWNTLKCTESNPDDISCVHGIRFIFSMTIYLLHRGVFGMFVPFSNRTEIARILEGEWTMIFRAFWNNVDSFVVLSGFLTSYYSFKKLQQGQNLNVWFMYAQRYYKFTPMYVITILILRFLAIEMRTGPNAIRVVKHFVLSCENNIWKTFFYLGNLDGMNEMCYPPAHQLITDMQMYLIAPAIVSLLWRYAHKGVTALFFVIALLTLYKGYVIYTNSLGSFIYYGASLSEMLASANQMYLNPLHRLTPYLFGMYLGYVIRTHGRHIKLTQKRVRIGWGFAIISATYSFFGPRHAASRHYVFDARESALFGMAQPILWSYALCWLIFICNAGKGGTVNKVLSWPGFIVFTRLSYSFYLTQILVIFFGIAGSNTPEFMRMHQIIDLNELFVVLAMSVTFTLLFLLPLGELHQLLIKKRAPIKRTPIGVFSVPPD